MEARLYGIEGRVLLWFYLKVMEDNPSVGISSYVFQHIIAIQLMLVLRCRHDEFIICWNILVVKVGLGVFRSESPFHHRNYHSFSDHVLEILELCQYIATRKKCSICAKCLALKADFSSVTFSVITNAFFEQQILPKCFALLSEYIIDDHTEYIYKVRYKYLMLYLKGATV